MNMNLNMNINTKMINDIMNTNIALKYVLVKPESFGIILATAVCKI